MRLTLLHGTSKIIRCWSAGTCLRYFLTLFCYKTFVLFFIMQLVFFTFRCHVLLLVGDMSPHLEDSVTMNSRMDPTNSTWMKVLYYLFRFIAFS